MASISRRWIGIGAILGAIGVALGAYGAHGLHHLLAEHGFVGDDLTRRLGNFETAVHYQMLHAIALVLTGLALEHRPNGAWRFAAWAFLIGIVLFSGLLKVLTFTGPAWNWLGAVVPVGGLSMMAGWIALAAGAIKR
jgi:uncharacterized membrane protein YgdD (TMEM256/DUF423 family)